MSERKEAANAERRKLSEFDVLFGLRVRKDRRIEFARPDNESLMIDILLRDLRQPEYIHVLLNPLPVYGLLVGLIGLLIAILLRSRKAKITALAIVLISSAAAWPTYEYGEQAYDRVLAMTDDPGHAWLDEHQHRAEQLIFVFYALAVLSAAAIVIPIKWPRTSGPLAMAALLLGAVALGMGAYIAQAGGKIRHREFRNQSPPPIRAEEEHEG